MVVAGFGCNFQDNKVIISAPCPNRQTLYEGPMLNNLFFLNIEYLLAPPVSKTRISCSHHFPKITTLSLSQPLAIINEDMAYFAKVPIDANLWHAHIYRAH